MIEGERVCARARVVVLQGCYCFCFCFAVLRLLAITVCRIIMQSFDADVPFTRTLANRSLERLARRNIH